MIGTFLIVFREGLEAFLLVGILLAYLRKLEAGRYAVWIFAGALAGAIVALAAAFAFEFAVNEFYSKTYRLILTGAIMLLAAAVLTYMAVWMEKQAREMTGSAKAHLRDYISTGNVIGIAFLAFVSVWREFMETILFLSALMFSGVEISWTGGALGAGLAALLVWLMMRGTRHLPIGRFFRWSSFLILFIAAGLLSSATNIFQGLGYLPGPLTPLFDLSAVLPDTSGVGQFLRGLFGYSASPSPLQFAVWFGFLSLSLTLWHRAYATSATPKNA